MKWFLLYLFVQIENIAAMLKMGKDIIVVGIVLIIARYAYCAMVAKDNDSMHSHMKSTRRAYTIGLACIVFGAFMNCMSYLVPTKQDMAIIVAGGITYSALTSDTAIEMGGKAMELLKARLDAELVEYQPLLNEATGAGDQ